MSPSFERDVLLERYKTLGIDALTPAERDMLQLILLKDWLEKKESNGRKVKGKDKGRT